MLSGQFCPQKCPQALRVTRGCVAVDGLSRPDSCPVALTPEVRCPFREVHLQWHYLKGIGQFGVRSGQFAWQRRRRVMHRRLVFK
jgi:hypothetical protein